MKSLTSICYNEQKTKKNRYLHYVIDSYMVDNSRYYVGDRMMYGKFAYLKGK